MKLLWGTANLFSNPRYMCGTSTNPDAHVFAYAAAQVKKALDVTKLLGWPLLRSTILTATAWNIQKHRDLGF